MRLIASLFFAVLIGAAAAAMAGVLGGATAKDSTLSLWSLSSLEPAAAPTASLIQHKSKSPMDQEMMMPGFTPIRRSDVLASISAGSMAIPRAQNATATASAAASMIQTTTTSTTTTTTTRKPLSEANGGAFPQQMQHSMVGLIGFCIMSLIIL